jgi:phosphate transport system protein
MLKRYEKEFKKVTKNILDITNKILKSNELILKALNDCDNKVFDKAKSILKDISKKIDEIDQDIITILALHSPEARDLRIMVAYLKTTNELLRASSNTKNFIKGFCNICKDVDKHIIQEYLISIQTHTIKAIKLTISMINIDCVDESQEIFNKILIENNKTEDLFEKLTKTILKEAKQTDDFNKYHTMLSSLRKSEKISNRAVSIASLLVFANVGGQIHRQ